MSGRRSPRSAHQQQQPVTAISPYVARGTAVVVTGVAILVVTVAGADGAQLLILWGAATLVLVAVAGLLGYILTTGQFPPRLTREGVELPPQDVADAGRSLDLVQKTLVELAERLERVEAACGLDDDESDGTKQEMTGKVTAVAKARSAKPARKTAWRKRVEQRMAFVGRTATRLQQRAASARRG
jgi:hypothetical protein